MHLQNYEILQHIYVAIAVGNISTKIVVINIYKKQHVCVFVYNI